MTRVQSHAPKVIPFARPVRPRAGALGRRENPRSLLRRHGPQSSALGQTLPPRRLIYVFSLGIVLDFFPPFGEVDDVVAFVIAAGAVAFSIKPHHKFQAQETPAAGSAAPAPPTALAASTPPPSAPILPSPTALPAHPLALGPFTALHLNSPPTFYLHLLLPPSTSTSNSSF